MLILNEKEKKSLLKRYIWNFKKKDENFFQKINVGSRCRFEEMKIIDEPLEKQKSKNEKIKEGKCFNDRFKNFI